MFVCVDEQTELQNHNMSEGKLVANLIEFL
jgi:hypothetical protein